jgi:ABC-2 type transport system ATP-binding protein
MVNAIEARGLVKTFGEVKAVQGLDLDVAQGETLALLGPNGAGKSTTVAMLATLLAPTEGTARVAGFDVVAQPDEVRRHIGVVFQAASLEPALTARQNLKFHAQLYGVPRTQMQERIEEALRFAELADRGDHPVMAFSGGMKRRLELARAVLHRPKVLFLDEPSTGLDPQARLHAWDMLNRLRQEHGFGVLLTTHHMDEAERLADRVAIVDHGKLLEQGTSASLRAALGAEVVRVRVGEGRDRFAAALAKGLGSQVQRTTWRGDEAELTVRNAEEALPLLLDLARDCKARIAGLDVHRATLEDVFIARTGRALREEAP